MSNGVGGAVSLNALLKKTEHYDKDERYMATSDLCALLQRHAASATSTTSPPPSTRYYPSTTSTPSLVMDASTERRICSAILALLDDSSNDVQAVAVKTLGVLLTTVHEEQAVEICDRLCSLVLDESKSELRDVYAIGLRTLVKTVPSRMGDVVSHRLVGRLLEGIRNVSSSEASHEEEILLCCLDVLTDLLSRFGSTSLAIRREHERILNAALGLCLSQENRPVVKKRAGNTIGCLAVVISDALLHRLVETLLTQIDCAKKGKRKFGDSSLQEDVDTRALIRTMCTISGTVGHRLGAQIDRIVPIFLRFCDPSEAITADDDADRMMEEKESMEEGSERGNEDEEAAVALANELRESCFSGFESFVLRCPLEVAPLLPQIIQAALAYMRYDPNYSYGEDDEDDEEEEDGNGNGNDEEDEYEEDEDEEFSDDDFDDDDDDSWKVRRSAVRALIAVVEAMKAEPSKLWTDEYQYGKKNKSVAGALVDRFKEREENCRIDIIDCFTRLLSFTVAASSAGAIALSQPKSNEGGAMDISDDSSGLVVIDLCSNYVPAIVKACHKQLSAKRGGERTKSSALALLSTLCIAPGGIGSSTQINSVCSHVKSILADSSGSKSLKLDALCMVRIMLACGQHAPSDIRLALKPLLPRLCSAVQEDWYKVIAEALRVLSEVPRFVLDKDDVLPPSDVASQLFCAIQPRLAAHDLDQEIKECALAAAANLLSKLHSHLSSDQLRALLNLILERLKNETTRLAALKTLAVVSAAPGEPSLDLSPILSDAVLELASLLRQQNRSLKQSSLEALDIVIQFHGKSEVMKDELFDVVLKEIGDIIVDSDLHISHLSLRTSISVLKVCPSSGRSVKTHILPPALSLSTSPLLQDLALDSLLALLEQLVLTNTVEFSALHSSLLSRLQPSGTTFPNKQAISNLAKCLAVVTASTTKSNQQKVVSDLISAMESKSEDVQVLLSLLTSGELGRRVDLSGGDVPEKLLRIYLHSFESKSEEIKHAAAYALGRAAIGAMPVFLPAILDALEQNSKKKQYLLLTSLKELIKCHLLSRMEISSSVDEIMPHLINHCSDKEEGVRTMVAECLGSLTCLEPSVILPQLQDLVSRHSGNLERQNEEEAKKDALVCWTVASSVKFAIAGQADPSRLSPFMPRFLALLKERDLSVRNAALLMVYSAVHHMPQLVAGMMQEHILPALYELAQLNLKRVVDLGPFKHTVDDALPLRKAALSIFATSLENCPASLDIPAFMPVLAKALEDVEDVQLQAHQIVISMCHHHPGPIVAAAESFVDPLEKTIHKKKGNKTGTELERENEWIKSVLRVVMALSQVEGATSSRKLADFVERTKNNTRFHPMLEALAEEH